MLNNRSEKGWDEKYASSKVVDSRALTLFSESNPTIHSLLPYLTPTSSVLEIGSGTGELSCYLSLTHGIDITGIDYSSVSVERSRKLASDMGASAVFIHGDICRMNLPSSSFDIVFGDQVIGHLDDIDTAIREIYRVLKPGGYCFVTTANKLRFDGWDLYKKLSQKKYSYIQKSFFPWEFSKLFTQKGFSWVEGYGDMFILTRNINLIKDRFTKQKMEASESQKSNAISLQKTPSRGLVKSVYRFLDARLPWWSKITIGVIVKKPL